MSGEVDALGALATASLAANALDTPPPSRTGHGACVNCGAALGGKFCANCGQAAHIHRSLIHVGHEFLHGITHFDGKAWKTVPMLIFRPGRLTRDYIMGHRARYVAPVPLFLLVVFLMFLVFSMVGIGDLNLGGNSDPAKAKANAARLLPGAEHSLADLDREIAQIKAGHGDKADLAGLESARAAIVATRDRLAARASGKNIDDNDPDWLAAIKASSVHSDLNINLGNKTLEERLKHAIANPELALLKIQGKAYKYSFLLVPMSLPWLWLVFFWKRGVRMYDHSVFALYSIAFMSLLFIAASLAMAAGVENGWFYGPLLFGIPLVHMFAQLKGAYVLGRWGAAWRTGVLAIASFTTIIVYLVLILVLGLLD